MKWKVRSLTLITLPVASSITLYLLAPLSPARGQITPDNTLGAETSILTPNVNIKGILSDRIDGGAIRGVNLFHSFGEFNVNSGQAVYFANPSGIENILSRVTGSNPSNILGRLGVLGNANLFLINPHGIVFGANAKLDLGGSFVASTASAFVFEGGLEFSATNPQAPPLLTTNIPIGLRFRENAPSNITVDQSILKVKSGQTLALVGGNVSVEGGPLGFLQASGGRVELAGVAGPGTVGLSVNGNDLRLSFPVGLTLSDISLTNYAEVDVRAGSGGSIAINAQNLNIAGGSRLLAGIRSGLGSVDSQAGNITLNATGQITVAESASILNQVETMATGKGGDVTLTAHSFTLDNAELDALTLGRGDAGRVFVQVDGDISLTNKSTIFNTVEPGAIGNAGGITIKARSVYMTNGGELQASTAGQGNAGNVTIIAQDRIFMDGVGSDGEESGIFSTEKPGGVGNGGSINITTRSLSLTNGAVVIANTRDQGSAGSVTITASEGISIDGLGSNGQDSGIYTTVAKGTGKGGDIYISTGSLSLTNGGEVSASTFDQGDAGNVTITASKVITLDGEDNRGFPSGIFSVVASEAMVNGGDINITAGSLSLTNGAVVAAETAGGNAGNIRVKAADFVTLSGIGSHGFSSGLLTSTLQGASGKGGDITVNTVAFKVQDGAVVNAQTANDNSGGSIAINANTFEAVNGGQVLTTTRSSGRAGNITLNVTDNVTLSGSDPNYANRVAKFGKDVVETTNEGSASGLFANTSENSTGKGGGISITTGQLVIQDGAQVTSSSQGTGDAGDILNITARSLKLDNGSITTTSSSGQGGNIDLLQVQDLLIMRNGSRISTSAGTDQNGGGDGGNMNINAQFIVAVPKENSDIQANAYTGKGGNIQITTSGIFGTKFRPQETPLSDITASSRFGVQGAVNIDTPGVDPSRGLVTLPDTPVDPAALVAQNPCLRGKGSAFVVTGRGGLPANPSDALSSDTTRVGLVEPTSPVRQEEQGQTTYSGALSIQNPKSKIQNPIVPAMGWVFNEKREVVLTADNPSRTFTQRSLAHSTVCGAP